MCPLYTNRTGLNPIPGLFGSQFRGLKIVSGFDHRDPLSWGGAAVIPKIGQASLGMISG